MCTQCAYLLNGSYTYVQLCHVQKVVATFDIGEFKSVCIAFGINVQASDTAIVYKLYKLDTEEIIRRSIREKQDFWIRLRRTITQNLTQKKSLLQMIAVHIKARKKGLHKCSFRQSER